MGADGFPLFVSCLPLPPPSPLSHPVSPSFFASHSSFPPPFGPKKRGWAQSWAGLCASDLERRKLRMVGRERERDGRNGCQVRIGGRGTGLSTLVRRETDLTSQSFFFFPVRVPPDQRDPLPRPNPTAHCPTLDRPIQTDAARLTSRSSGVPCLLLRGTHTFLRIAWMSDRRFLFASG